jgi:hypothetical protein
MDKKDHITEKEFREWLAVQPQRAPDGLDGRILARVRQAPSPAERAEQRAKRNLLIASIVLGAIVLGIGIATLLLFTDLRSLFGAIRMPEFPLIRPVESIDPQTWSLVTSLLPFAGIVWLLLMGDFLLRRRFLKH